MAVPHTAEYRVWPHSSKHRTSHYRPVWAPREPHSMTVLTTSLPYRPSFAVWARYLRRRRHSRNRWVWGRLCSRCYWEGGSRASRRGALCGFSAGSAGLTGFGRRICSPTALWRFCGGWSGRRATLRCRAPIRCRSSMVTRICRRFWGCWGGPTLRNAEYQRL